MHWPAVHNNDYLSLQRISSPLQWLPVPTTGQQFLAMITCPYNGSAVPGNDYLCLQRISNPWQWLPVPTTDQQSLTVITCPYHWSAVPNNDYLSLTLISCPYNGSAVPDNDYLSLQRISSPWQWLSYGGLWNRGWWAWGMDDVNSAGKTTLRFSRGWRSKVFWLNLKVSWSFEKMSSLEIEIEILSANHPYLQPEGWGAKGAAQRDQLNACERRLWQPPNNHEWSRSTAAKSMFFDLGKGQTTTPGTSCPTLYE